jgi:hypothetical protein
LTRTRIHPAALPDLRRQGGGRVVNIASTRPSSRPPDSCPTPSPSTAWEGLTRSLAVELGPGRDGELHLPRPVNTVMTAPIPDDAKEAFARRRPLTALRDPEEVAPPRCSVVAASSYITGAVRRSTAASPRATRSDQPKPPSPYPHEIGLSPPSNDSSPSAVSPTSACVNTAVSRGRTVMSLQHHFGAAMAYSTPSAEASRSGRRATAPDARAEPGPLREDGTPALPDLAAPSSNPGAVPSDEDGGRHYHQIFAEQINVQDPPPCPPPRIPTSKFEPMGRLSIHFVCGAT